MALVYGADTDNAAIGCISPSTRTSEPDLLATYEIPGSRTHKFNPYGRFKVHLGRAAADFLSGIGSAQYHAFSGVPLSSLRSIDRGRRRSELPGMKVFYDPNTQILVTKLMAGPHHELASSLFADMFRDKVASGGLPRSSFYDLGTTRYEPPGGRAKEADRALRPASWNRATDWSSLVIEVGVAESLSQLRTDGRQTRVVILISIETTSRVVKLSTGKTHREPGRHVCRVRSTTRRKCRP